MKNKIEIFDFLETKIRSGVWLLDNHNNYNFLEYWDLFHSGKDFAKVKRSFNKDMKQFVEMGMVKKNISYLSARDASNFGRRPMITYSVVESHIKRNLKP